MRTGQRCSARAAALTVVFYLGIVGAPSAPAGAETTAVGIAARFAPAAIQLGGTFEITATLTAATDAPPPTGVVAISVYGPDDTTCSSRPVLSSSAALDPTGTTATTPALTPPAGAGSYRAIATYAGDAANASAASPCGDPLAVAVVGKAPSQLSAATSAPTIVLGQPIGYTATLGPPAAGAPQRTGTVRFDLYPPGDPTCSGPVAFSSTNAVVTRGTDAASDPYLPPSTGSYRVIATYGGDADYGGATSACSDPAAITIVDPAPLTLHSAVAPPAVGAGGRFTDTATLAGAPAGLPSPTGTVAFAVYGPADPNCRTTPVYSSTNPVAASGTTAISSTFAPTTPGTYEVTATYSGDATYAPATAGCRTSSAAATLAAAPIPAVRPPTPTAKEPKPARRAPVTKRPAPATTPAPAVTPPPTVTAPARVPSPRRAAPSPAARQAPAPPRPVVAPVRSDDRWRPQAKQVIGVEVGFFTLLALAGGGGLGRAALRRAGAHTTADSHAASSGSGGGGGGGGGGGANFDVDYEGVEIVALAAAGGLAVGDRSRTWQWPGTARIDAAAVSLPARLSRRSPLLARVIADGVYLRSIFGSAALVGPLVGVLLGVIAVDQAGGRALPPSTALTITIAGLGVIDAAAGLAAVLTFLLGVVVSGGLDSNDAVRTMMGLAALWFVVPVVAGAARPLRRDPPRNAQQRYDRLADFVIASLIGAWAVQKIVIALPGLSGYKLPIGSHANEIALWVLGILVVRMLGEQLAAHFYPARLVTVQPRDVREPPQLQLLATALLRTGIFLFIAVVVVGSTWQLWVAGVLFLVPQAMDVYEERFPKSPALGRVLPEGLVELVLMLFLLTGLGALLLTTHSKALIADSFVLLSIPGAILAILHLFGGEAEEEEEQEEGDEGEAESDEGPKGWTPRIVGTAILGFGVLQVLGLLF